MTTEEKIDSILKKVSEKKERDNWEKIQIIGTIGTGVLAVVLTCFNLLMTKSINEQSRRQADMFHRDQQQQIQDEVNRKETDAYIQEMNILPSIANMLTNPNPDIRRIARVLLDSIKTNRRFKGHPIIAMTTYPIDSSPAQNPDALVKLGSADGSFWAYLGQKENGKWQSRNFNIFAMPAVKTEIIATTDVYQHDHSPTKIGERDTWDFGKTIGVLKEKSKVLVLDTLTLDGNNYWALLK